MAVVGTGIDVVDVARMRRALSGGAVGARMKRRVFTEDEVRYCESRGRKAAESYAARFAAKEAVMKALGYRARLGFAWPDIEIVRTKEGKPTIVLHGRTRAKARRLGAGDVHVSITHIDRVAIAHAVVEGS